MWRRVASRASEGAELRVHGHGVYIAKQRPGTCDREALKSLPPWRGIRYAGGSNTRLQVPSVSLFKSGPPCSVVTSEALVRGTGDDDLRSTRRRHGLISRLGHRGYTSMAQRAVEASPPGVRPYLELLRLDKPAGTHMLFWPCAWGAGMASVPGLVDPSVLALFAGGALVMRGAGCIINDMWDAGIDSKVDRTKSRPMAAGVVSYKQAAAFLTGNLMLGLGILTQLKPAAVMLGFSAMPLVVAYPYMKRITFWPQAFLGLTFNYGVLVGWAAVSGAVDWSAALPLYTAGACWTMVYDTIYAHQDKKDDILVGVKSTALRFGSETSKWLTFFGAASVGSMVAAGATVGLGSIYYASVGAVAAHYAWQLSDVNYNEPMDCMAKFKVNWHIGLLVFLGIELDTIVASL